MNHLRYGYFKHLKMTIWTLFFENKMYFAKSWLEVVVQCSFLFIVILVQSQIFGISLYKKLNTLLTGRDLVKTHLCAVASHRVWWLINPCPAWFDRHLMPANFIQEPTTPKWPKMQLQRTLNLFRIILALGHNDRRKISG